MTLGLTGRLATQRLVSPAVLAVGASGYFWNPAAEPPPLAQAA